MSCTCRAEGCDRHTEKGYLMCWDHWALVPKGAQRLVWQHWRDGKPSPSYKLAVSAAVLAVRDAEAIAQGAGARVQLPSLGPGTIQAPPWSMPNHHLIRFDTGELLWMPRHICSPLKFETKQGQLDL